MTDLDHGTEPLPKLNGICPVCGNPAHWALAPEGYLHPGCEVA